MQQYLVDEFVEEYQEGHLSRRQALRQLTLIVGSGAAAASILAACGGPAASPTAAPTAAPKAAEPTKPAAVATTAPAATTAPTTAPAAATTAATTAPAAATKPAEPTKPAAAATTAPAAGAGTPAAAAKPTPNPVTIQPTDPAISGAAMVEIDGPAGKLMGYQARPAGAGPFPIVIVIHENRGLTDHIQDVVRRAAKAGYIAIGPDLLSRAGGTAKFTEPQQATGAIGQLTPDGVVADLKAFITHLQGLSGVQKDRLGVTGYCWGGGQTWRIASQSADVKAAVPFYGGGAPPPEELKKIKAAVLGIYGGNDERVNASIPAAEQALKEAGVTYQIKIYPGANHAFHNDTGANYNAEAAKDAWAQTIAWFDKYLKS
jgi:carboxymethylenebutenolidase